MHDTARTIGQEFFRIYCQQPACQILEVGSQNVNGTLREMAPEGAIYTGIDMVAGDGVDVVVENPYHFPFADERFDAIASSSCFEHSQLFWLAFIEMLRVLKPGGFIYINAPANGPYHSYPYDNWRFYPDSAVALTVWAARQGIEVALVESFTARRQNDIWNDAVMVFRKGPVASDTLPERLLADSFSTAFNIRTYRGSDILNFEELSEDMLLLQAKDAEIGRLSELTAGAAQRQAARDAAFADVERQLSASFAENITRLANEVAARDAEIARLRHCLEQTRTWLEAEETTFERILRDPPGVHLIPPRAGTPGPRSGSATARAREPAAFDSPPGRPDVFLRVSAEVIRNGMLVRELQRELATIRRSPAWRALAPLRAANRMVASIRRRLKGARKIGRIERFVGPLFDADYYIAKNPDIAQAQVVPLDHFCRTGWREGRNPNPLFDVNWYLETYEDVAAAGLNPVLHYADVGWREGRDPGPDFSVLHYLRSNPDVLNAGQEPLQHYLRQGRREGRTPLPR